MEFRRRLVLFLPSKPRFSPAAAFLHDSKHNKDVAVKLSRTSSCAIFALRLLPAVPSRLFVAATGTEALQSRRQALLHAAASFDGDIGSLLLAFTHQVPKLYVVWQTQNLVIISQHAFKCSSAEITELERIMQLSHDDLTVRSIVAAARVFK